MRNLAVRVRCRRDEAFIRALPPVYTGLDAIFDYGAKSINFQSRPKSTHQTFKVSLERLFLPLGSFPSILFLSLLSFGCRAVNPRIMRKCNKSRGKHDPGNK
jgi:hypothetical protein